MKMSKQIFLILGVLVGMTLMAACEPVEIKVVPLYELVNDPEKYMGQSIAVEGEVTKSLGEHSYFLVFAYPHTSMCQQDTDPDQELCTEIKMSLSQVRVAVFEFSDGKQTILVTERTGGLYLPIPIVPASSPELPEGKIRITGEWTKDSEGNYNLHISGTDPIPTSIP
jgi:hypothetical protein